MMAGTLLLLGKAGYDLHYLNIANGSCGTATHTKEEIVAIRTGEARYAAGLLGAKYHPPFVDDIDIFYENDLLAKVGAVVREVQPRILLVPSPQDYMEDHVNAGRLAVTAAFCREMRNFPTDPPVAPVGGEVTVYHALPYGLRDGLRRLVVPEYYVDISEVLAAKREALAQHRSQKEWLDESQGLDAYLETMEHMSAEVGRLSGRWEYAEGWRRHSHLGFCQEDDDPVMEALGERVLVNEDYRRGLNGSRA
ncbi:MAG: PIG-L family deacetylase [Armatimonadetes bacterium]|nr:PIG-L family deacetylase [Armatimonadota bacterium]